MYRNSNTNIFVWREFMNWLSTNSNTNIFVWCNFMNGLFWNPNPNIFVWCHANMQLIQNPSGSSKSLDLVIWYDKQFIAKDCFVYSWNRYFCITLKWGKWLIFVLCTFYPLFHQKIRKQYIETSFQSFCTRAVWPENWEYYVMLHAVLRCRESHS